MENTIYLLKFAGFTMLWGLALIGMYFINYKYKQYKSNKRFEEAKFNCLYQQVQRLLQEPSSKANRDRIKDDLKYLARMKHTDIEKLQTANCEWMRKYYDATLTTEFGE